VGLKLTGSSMPDEVSKLTRRSAFGLVGIDALGIVETVEA
jgi:hypothetical protein